MARCVSPGAAEHGLVGLLVAVDDEGRVLVLEAVQRAGQLVVVGLRLGDDRGGEHRRRLLDRGDVHRLALGGERVAGGGAGQLGHAADVAGRQRVDRLVLLAPHHEQAVEPLVGAGAAVHEVVVVADRARQHLEQRHLADERVGDRLEHDGERLRRRGRPAPRPRCRRPATVAGRSAGGGPISTSRSASRSMPTSAVAEPHTTGNTLAVSMPSVRACSSSSSAGHVALEVALEQRRRRPRRCPRPGCRAPGARAPPCRRGSARCAGRRPRRGGRCR